MAKNLLIVESPAKAKTIEKILGDDFEVKSCYGHIRDLEKDNMGIDVNNNYKPTYKVPEDKEKVVKELKSSAKKSGEVWLATDEDLARLERWSVVLRGRGACATLDGATNVAASLLLQFPQLVASHLGNGCKTCSSGAFSAVRPYEVEAVLPA